MASAAFEKTVKFLSKTDNPAAMDILRLLLDDTDWKVKASAFDALFLKRDPAIYLELFTRFLKDENDWLLTSVVNPDRLGRLADVAIRSNDIDMVKLGVDACLRHKLYDGLKSMIPLMESPREDVATVAAKGIYSLAEKFYEELAACKTATELKNLDRRREWMSTELEGPVRRYELHGMMEAIKAFLMVTRRDYESFVGVLNDQHSKAAKIIYDLLENGDHGSYLRLLLSYINDGGAPASIDLIICKRKDIRFVRYLLDTIGPNPSQDSKAALKRFKDFDWLDPNNPEFPAMYQGFEPNLAQVVANISLTRERSLEMFKYIFEHCSPEGRRTAAELLRGFTGDDYNQLIVSVVNDPDPETCSSIVKLIKQRNFKEADQILLKLVERPEPEIHKTIYDLVPDYHIDNYLQKVEQLTEFTATNMGRIVLKVDPNTEKTLTTEINSTAPIRRLSAVDAIRHMGIGQKFQEKLIEIMNYDDEVNTRIAACQTLSTILTREAYTALQNATQERAFAIRNAAVEAMQKWMTHYNETFGQTPQQ